MPTGYTAAIKDGITFEEYALGCARAFGALVLMRDEPSDAPIPEKFEESDYHTLKLVELAAREQEILNMTAEQIESAALESWNKAEAHRTSRLEESRALRSKYEAMLESVDAWASPSPDHDKYKAFMRSQIEESIQWDCDEGCYANPAAKQSGADWAIDQLTEIARQTVCHTKEHAAEVERTNKRNEWIRLVRESFRQPTMRTSNV
jgi:hypothetical protein